MVYLDKNSTKVLFPRISIKEITLITFTNQITKEIFDCSVTDETTNNNYYTVDLSGFLDLFTVGQYDYTLYSDNVSVGTGIMQFGEYKPEYKIYDTEITFKQYNV